MARPRATEMTADEFLRWNLTQDQRYELVDGIPVPLRAMTGASNYHDRIVSNLMGLLFEALKGTGCWAATADTALRTSIKRVRRPDVTIQCDAPKSETYESTNPLAAFEVLSPTTSKHDRTVKLAEYMRHPTLRTIVHIDPDVMAVVVYARLPDQTWVPATFDRASDQIELAGPSARLTIGDIYGGVPLATPSAGHDQDNSTSTVVDQRS